MLSRREFVAGACAAGSLGAFHHVVAHADPSQPLEVIGNRPYVTAELVNGSVTREVACWLDTGGDALLLAQPVSEALALQATGPQQGSGEQLLQPVAAPRLLVDADEIDIPSDAVFVALGGPTIDPGVAAQGLLPARFLRGHRVLLDYPGRKFALDARSSEGIPLPVDIDVQSGMPRLDAVIDGQHVGLLLDTGASFSMLSRSFMDALAARHADWHSVYGAYGAANMIGGRLEADARMLRVPQISLGELQLKDVAFVSRPEGTFERWTSSMTSAPVVGALGGNVLRYWRLELDYPRSRVSALITESSSRHDSQIVPITLTPSFSRGYAIDGVMDGAKVSAPREAMIGKTLLAVDDRPVAGKYLNEIDDLLRGNEGETHRLKLSGGTVVTAAVARIL
ncbi:MAG: retropepsin-like domain-containing protein [Candidatus Eremiobacteraeota bacterium]|nr:retropepsin-like domain-containing protein [Candidatus Eremiobacteraeota bacterium]